MYNVLKNASRRISYFSRRTLDARVSRKHSTNVLHCVVAERNFVQLKRSQRYTVEISFSLFDFDIVIVRQWMKWFRSPFFFVEEFIFPLASNKKRRTKNDNNNKIVSRSSPVGKLNESGVRECECECIRAAMVWSRSSRCRQVASDI